MASFELDGIKLEIPDECLSSRISEALRGGRYEGSEARALKRHLKPSDRVVDLGAGAGYLSTLAARVVGGGKVLGIEGNPVMAQVAQANLHRNGAKRATVLHGAVVPDDFAGDYVRFRARQAFWGGGIDTTDEPNRPSHVDVPVLRISEILARHDPTLVVMDIEGTEADLAGHVWPATVRLVIMEVHSNRYPASALQAIFTGFFDQGFTYCPRGSWAETLVFERVPVDA